MRCVIVLEHHVSLSHYKHCKFNALACQNVQPPATDDATSHILEAHAGLVSIWCSKREDRQNAKRRSTANVLIIGIGGNFIKDATDNLPKGRAKRGNYFSWTRIRMVQAVSAKTIGKHTITRKLEGAMSRNQKAHVLEGSISHSILPPDSPSAIALKTLPSIPKMVLASKSSQKDLVPTESLSLRSIQEMFLAVSADRI